MRNPVRRFLGDRVVHREVQGVGLWMPWSHRLPDYAKVAPAYGQNLVRFAQELGSREALALQFVDVGANIGDSTLQVLASTDAQALAIEADPYYLGYLRRNVEPRGADVTVAPVLLTLTQHRATTWSATRSGGTTHFTPDAREDARAGVEQSSPALPVSDLPDAFPQFDRVRLIKSDTDGYDSELIPALARAYAASRPALFFEYDPRLTAEVSGNDVGEVWHQLAALGYEHVAFWDNAGAFLECAGIGRALDIAELRLAGSSSAAYLDVAVVHGLDRPGGESLSALAPATLSRPESP